MLTQLFFVRPKSHKQTLNTQLKTKIKQFFVTGALALISVVIVSVTSVQAQNTLVTPTILKPNTSQIATAKPLIAGVSLNDTLVEVFIDEELVGNTQTHNHPSGVGNFFWKTKTALTVGTHEITVRSVDTVTQEHSAISTPTVITIIPFGQPTLLLPESITITHALTYIEGVAHNDSQIRVLIDGNLVEEFSLGSHESGAVGFHHILKKPITQGTHTIALQAKGPAGRTSNATAPRTINIIDFPAPTILTPEPDTKVLPKDIVITGVAFNDSTVEVYIDDIKDGEFAVEDDESGIAYFVYELQNQPTPGTYHTLKTRAKDSKGRVSTASNSVTIFTKEYYTPPTLLQTRGSGAYPVVAGVANNDSVIEIYVDDVLDNTITPENHTSGTLYFEQQLVKPLTGGAHTITAVAYDAQNKPSLPSNKINYTYFVPITTPTDEPIDEQEVVDVDVTKPDTEEKTDIIIKEDETDGFVEIIDPDPDIEGTIETPDEEEGTIIADEAVQEDELPTEPNWPLILGLIILVGLAIIFIIWYLGQKRKLLNEGIDKLFSDEEIQTPSIDTSDTTDTTPPPSSSDDIPPPPPAI